jgi:hypothetical protein
VEASAEVLVEMASERAIETVAGYSLVEFESVGKRETPLFIAWLPCARRDDAEWKSKRTARYTGLMLLNDQTCPSGHRASHVKCPNPDMAVKLVSLRFWGMRLAPPFGHMNRIESLYPFSWIDLLSMTMTGVESIVVISIEPCLIDVREQDHLITVIRPS